jgi:putative transposase
VTGEHDRTKRRPTRVPGIDYSAVGCYFVTICSHDRQHIFSSVCDGVMRRSNPRDIAAECWVGLPDHYPDIVLDLFVVMPNHVHGIITIDIPDVYDPDIYRDEDRRSLTEVVRGFKTFSARQINAVRDTRGQPVWQRSFHDHIIRSEKSFGAIRSYITQNPALWDKDTYFA